MSTMVRVCTMLSAGSYAAYSVGLGGTGGAGGSAVPFGATGPGGVGGATSALIESTNARIGDERQRDRFRVDSSIGSMARSLGRPACFLSSIRADSSSTRAENDSKSITRERGSSAS
jgi:hypothetical protein